MTKRRSLFSVCLAPPVRAESETSRIHGPPTERPYRYLLTAGKSKKQLKAEEARREMEAKRIEAEARAQRQAMKAKRQVSNDDAHPRQPSLTDTIDAYVLQVEKQEERTRQKAASQAEKGSCNEESTTLATDAAEDDVANSSEAFADLMALLQEPSVLALSESRRDSLCAQDTLTSQPRDDDQLLFAVPVCAPYSVLVAYRYKIKLTPGVQKRGKAAKQAIGVLSASTTNARERDLIRAVGDDELVRVMVGNVKVAAPGKMLQAQKKDAKIKAKEQKMNSSLE